MMKFMRRVCVAAVLAALSFSAVRTEVFYGSTKLKKQEFDTVTVNGSLQFEEIKVSSLTVNGAVKGKDSALGAVTVNGSFDVKDCSSDGLTVNGYTEISDVKVEGAVTVNGRLSAKDSKMKRLSVAANIVSLDDCVVDGDILIRPAQGFSGGATTSWIPSWIGTTVRKTTNWVASWFSSSEQAVDEEDEESDMQKLYLKGDTKVTGSISFESGNGIIIKSAKATLTGSVTGGEIR